MFKTQCVLGLIALIVEFAHPWEFAVSRGDLLEFYNSQTKINTISIPSHNLTALTYDDVHNMMLYVDKQNNNDAICAHDITSIETKCLTERNGKNIYGLAFDPATELLFFSDTNERSIYWISLKSDSNKKENLLFKMDDGIPTDVAVDSCRGYVYWITIDLMSPTIERARFNGSDREVIIDIDTTYQLEPHSLIIDQQKQKMYWMEPKNSTNYRINHADLNGKNKNWDSSLTWSGKISNPSSNTLAVSNTSLFWNEWCITCSRVVSKYKKLKWKLNLRIYLETKRYTGGIVANYKIKEQIQGIDDCEALKSVERRISDGPFCVHGMKVVGKSLCECTPGYIGERCDVSICENYCLHGSCTLSNDGLPNCSCENGHSGERCEVDACHGFCQNDGECSLNEQREPVCRCKGGHAGDRCEVSGCVNYCLQGNCTINDDGLPICSCEDGHSGERCEVDACHGFCQNDGECSLNEQREPVCRCKGGHAGDRCEVSGCVNYCLQGNCTINDDGLPICSCEDGHSGERCEVDACHGFCQNDGECSLNEQREPVCQCKGGHVGDRCEVSGCVNYCLYGNCTINEEGLPICSCENGHSGERCEVDACHGFCQNDGECSLNEQSEPVCQCKGGHAGDRCEVLGCVNYCLYGNCTINDDGLPICRCNAGYSGERCEVNACHEHCLNDGVCSLNEEDEPVCQCTADYEGERCEVTTTHTGACGSADKLTQQMLPLLLDLRSEVKQVREDLRCNLQLYTDKLDENAAKLQICEESINDDQQNHNDTISKPQTSNI